MEVPEKNNIVVMFLLDVTPRGIKQSTMSYDIKCKYELRYLEQNTIIYSLVTADYFTKRIEPFKRYKIM